MNLGKTFPFILLALSCSSNKPISLLKPRPRHTAISYDQIYRCRIDNKKEIFLGNSEHYSYFQEMINRLKKDNINLSGSEKFVLWGLSQSLLRPDQLSPDSHSLIVINYKKTTNFFASYSKNQRDYRFGFYSSLDFLLKRYKSPRNLSKLVELFDKYYPLYITAGKDLANFLLAEKENLEKTRKSYPIYFRGEDLLLSNEYYRRPTLKKRLLKYISMQKNKAKVKSLKLKQSDESRLKCNFDINPYLSGKLTNQVIHENSYYIGYQRGDFTILLGAQTKINWKRKSLKNTFPNASSLNSSPVCFFQGLNSQFILSSHKGKDPAQTLSHFYRYGIENLTEIKQVYRLTNFARHLILKNPTRILYESQRGAQGQLKKLNSLNIPIYHAKQIGEITGLIQIENQRSNFLLDDRSSIRENCRQ